MPRPPLPLGTYGKIKTWQEGKTWLARVKFRDFDGIVRFVKRSGKTKAAAERELKTALAERQLPVTQSKITAQTTIEKVAELWLVEIEHAVDAGSKSPSTLDTYRTIYGRHVKPAIGALRVREVDTPVVDRVLAAIKQKTVSGARTAKIVISGLMRLAARHGAVTINPVRETARIEGTSGRKPRSMTAQERHFDEEFTFAEGRVGRFFWNVCLSCGWKSEKEWDNWTVERLRRMADYIDGKWSPPKRSMEELDRATTDRL